MEIEDNGDLKLDTDSVRERTGVRSSLTDINQIFVFTNEFEKQKKAVESARESAEEELRDTVFAEQFQYEGSTDITDFMFLESTEELLIRNEQEMTQNPSRPVIWLLPAAVLVCVTAFIYMRKRKGKQKHDADDQLKAIARE